MMFKILFLAIFLELGKGEPESRLVNTLQGPVIGYKLPKDDVYVFNGIPYATAPTGPNKFKAPLPPPTWDEPFEAVDKNVICLQPNSNEMKMQEDCLITNIYVPDTLELNLPVLIYFHGGAFFTGYGSFRTPINLVKSKKIIAIDFNYRLGVHGFLCLGTEDIPGNAGLKDQLALLQWVQRNIGFFGGNPNDVTIDGYSAGASSVDIMVLTPIAKGLFHKVISESAAGVAAITLQIDPLQNARNIADQLSFNGSDDLKDLEAFFKTKSYSELISVDLVGATNSATIISPCIEHEVSNNTIIAENLFDILKSGNFPKLPTLYGNTDREGKYRINDFDVWKDRMNEKFSDFLPQDLGFSSELEKEQVAQEVKQFYFGFEPVSEKNILSYVDYFTDTMFSYGIARAAQLLVKAGNDKVYLYEYSFVDDNEEYIPYTNVRGASHCAQTLTVLDDVSDEQYLSKEVKQMKTILRDIWLNFITTGEPVPKDSSYPDWKPINENRSPHMYLNLNSTLKSEYLEQRAHFWDNIYDKYYKGPQLPSK